MIINLNHIHILSFPSIIAPSELISRLICLSNVPTITLASSPALARMGRAGVVRARLRTATPSSWLKLMVGMGLASGYVGDEVMEELPPSS